MPKSQSGYAGGNRILLRLSPREIGLLAPHLEAVDLPVRKKLEISNKPIEHVYFIESGLACVVARAPGGRSVEIGMIGREGITGLAVIMGTDRSPHETFMQLEGAGRRIAAAELRQGIEQGATLHRTLLRFGHAFLVQTAHTSMANRRSTIEERLARWLLMAHDRAGSDDLALTHEFLAQMLGVRRPGVSVALHQLERDGLIRTDRGAISILDREGLVQGSRGAYGAAEAEYRRLFG